MISNSPILAIKVSVGSLLTYIAKSVMLKFNSLIFLSCKGETSAIATHTPIKTDVRREKMELPRKKNVCIILDCFRCVTVHVK
jgi:hypothetical protein